MDDEQTSIQSTAYHGFAFWGQTLGSSRASTIFNASPRGNNSHGTLRAFRVQNIPPPDDGPPVRPREIFFVQLGGAIYTEGSLGLGVNPGSNANVQLDAKRDIRTTGVLISGKGLRPPHLQDSAAETGTIYFSNTRGALVYKDVSGSVHNHYIDLYCFPTVGQIKSGASVIASAPQIGAEVRVEKATQGALPYLQRTKQVAGASPFPRLNPFPR